MPYRRPPERPSDGPTDEELASIARACGIEPQWDAPVQSPAPPFGAADELREAQERSKSRVGPVALALLIALTALAMVAGISVIAFGLIVAQLVPGLVGGVTK